MKSFGYGTFVDWQYSELGVWANSFFGSSIAYFPRRFHKQRPRFSQSLSNQLFFVFYLRKNGSVLLVFVTRFQKMYTPVTILIHFPANGPLPLSDHNNYGAFILVLSIIIIWIWLSENVELRWQNTKSVYISPIAIPEKNRDRQLHSTRSQPSDGVRSQTWYLDASPGSGDLI